MCTNPASSRVLGPISINGISTHPSHSLILKDGVYLCVACGFKAQFKIHKLSLSCNFTKSDYGRANEKKAEAGTLSEVPAFSATSRRGTFSTGAGITIQRPVPRLSSTIATLPPSAPPPPQHPLRVRDPYSSLPLFYQNLQDLVELEEAGEAVIWPPGLDRVSATVAIKEALQSGNVEHMHFPSSAMHADNFSMHQFSVPVTGTQDAPLPHSVSSSSGPVIPEVLDPLDDPALFFEED